jgi:thioredoxin-related protein
MKKGEGREWKTFEDAKAEVGVGQIILLQFTGSDWCPPCKKMKADVFDMEDWKKYQAENVQSVILDFPRNTQLSDVQRTYNDNLQKKFKIEGYPTYIILGPDGTERSRKVGYMVGGPSRFADWITNYRLKN